ncbi:hypothetical protein G7Y89_g981 [Cudoniella acicularis]|uniref:C2H2-type domain-containing protein n=1 Tax=Cudoniella acicularis TaxID=354080 RepID=A0A8H4W7E0_9HELO|nr:hypothetical protein G7Y89_g981 [Cudoniella acicularis]
MSRSREEMMDWVLGAIRKAQPEGISISSLFEQFGNVFTADENTKNELWTTIANQNDVLVGDVTTALIFSKLTLQDVTLLQLGHRNITLRNPPQNNPPHASQGDVQAPINDPSNPQLPPSEILSRTQQMVHEIESNENLEASTEVVVQPEYSPAAPLAPAIPPPKRRGRPPKKKPAPGQTQDQTSTQNPSQIATQFLIQPPPRIQTSTQIPNEPPSQTPGQTPIQDSTQAHIQAHVQSPIQAPIPAPIQTAPGAPKRRGRPPKKRVTEEPPLQNSLTGGDDFQPAALENSSTVNGSAQNFSATITAAAQNSAPRRRSGRLPKSKVLPESLLPVEDTTQRSVASETTASFEILKERSVPLHTSSLQAPNTFVFNGFPTLSESSAQHDTVKDKRDSIPVVGAVPPHSSTVPEQSQGAAPPANLPESHQGNLSSRWESKSSTSSQKPSSIPQVQQTNYPTHQNAFPAEHRPLAAPEFTPTAPSQYSLSLSLEARLWALTPDQLSPAIKETSQLIVKSSVDPNIDPDLENYTWTSTPNTRTPDTTSPSQQIMEEAIQNAIHSESAVSIHENVPPTHDDTSTVPHDPPPASVGAIDKAIVIPTATDENVSNGLLMNSGLRIDGNGLPQITTPTKYLQQADNIAPAAEESVEIPLASTTKRKPGRPRKDNRHHEAGGPSTPSKSREKIKEATYTSFEEMQRQAGVPGVYYDEHDISRRKSRATRRGADSEVLFFKSDKLKDPGWLNKQRGSWEEPVFSRIASAAVATADSAIPPSRRKRKNVEENTEVPGQVGEDKPKKKRKTKEAVEAPAFDNIGDQGTGASQNSQDPKSNDVIQTPVVVVEGQIVEPSQQMPTPYVKEVVDTSIPIDTAQAPMNGRLDVQGAGTTQDRPMLETKNPVEAQVSDHEGQDIGAKQKKRKSQPMEPSESTVETAPKRPRKDILLKPDLPRVSNPDSLDMGAFSSGLHVFEVNPGPALGSNMMPGSDPQGPFPGPPTSHHVQPSMNPMAAPYFTHPTSNNAFSIGHPASEFHRLPHIQGLRTQATQPSYSSPYGSPYATPSAAPQNRQAETGSYGAIAPTVGSGNIPQHTFLSQVGVAASNCANAVEPSFYTQTSFQPATPYQNGMQHAISSQPGSIAKPNFPPELAQQLSGSTPSSMQRRVTAGPRRGPFSVPDPLGAEEEARRREFFKPVLKPSVDATTPTNNGSPSPVAEATVSENPIQSPDSAPGDLPVPATATPKKDKSATSKLSRKQKIAAQKIASEAVLQQAEQVLMPKMETRLTCIYEETGGNLILSTDKTVLEFFAMEQHPPEIPMFVLPISELDENPKTSIFGSYPMELRISSKSNGRSVTHCFQFSTEPKGLDAAGKIRAKIVTARIAFQFRSGEGYSSLKDAEAEVTHPFKCDRCGQQYKNDVGLKYHLAKSQTSCNPNFDPSQAKRKKKVAPPEKPTVHKKPRVKARRTSSKHPTADLDHDSESETGENFKELQDNSSSDSDNSVLEWAQKHSTTGLTRKPLAPAVSAKKARIYRSLPGELSLLKSTLQNVVPNDDAIEMSGIARPAGTSDGQSFKDLILQLVHDNGGLFPGDKALWIAFVAAWLKKGDKSGNLPETKFCRRSLDELVDENKLQTFSFTFRDEQSRPVTRSFIAEPGFNTKSPEVDSLQKTVMELHPQFFVPSEYAPEATILSQLQSIAGRSVARRESDLNNEGKYLFPRRGRRDSSFSIDDTSFNDEPPDDDGDVFIPDDAKDVNPDEPPRMVQGHYREPSWRSGHSDALRAKWAERKAAGFNTLYNSETPARPGEKRLRVPMSQENKEKRARNVFIRLHAWGPAPTKLQNPDTAAWDQVPARPRPPKKRRDKLPEPITYLQAKDGSWSQRAFGHGVKPIFARPSRRADGNPYFPQYLEQLNNGFRPISYPLINNQLHLPAKPSKYLMKSLAQSASETPPSNLEYSIELDEDDYDGADGDEFRISEQSGQPEHHSNRSNRLNANQVSTPSSRRQPRKARQVSNDTESGIGISKATGLPVRKYSRREPGGNHSRRLSQRLSVSDDSFDKPWIVDSPAPVRRSTRVRAAEPLDEIQILNFFEPKKLEDGAPVNPGLETLPSNFGFADSKNQEARRLPNQNNSIQFIEPEAITSNCDFSKGSWSNFDLNIQSTEFLRIRWQNGTAFTVESLPYNELQTEDEFEPEPANRSAPSARRQRRKSLSAPSVENERLVKTRPQTAIPADFQGVLDDLAQAPKIFNVQMIEQPPLLNRRILRTMRDLMTPSVQLRFIVAVVVIQTLAGGLDRHIDFVLVTSLFPQFSNYFLTKYYGILRKKILPRIEEITADFTEAFLPAYHKGEVPPINYDNLPGYDWNALIDWAFATIKPTLNPKPILLPETRKKLKQDYRFIETETKAKTFRDLVFAPGTAMYKRIGMVAAMANATPVIKQKDGGDGSELDYYTIAKSVVRAASISPDECWSVDAVKVKLSQFEKEETDEALAELKKTKVIMPRKGGRALPGRNYECTDTFSSVLRRHMKENQFVEARNFKRFLDENFYENRKVSVDYMADEGAVMCITSLQAAGRVEIRGVDIPQRQFGFTRGGYDTKTIPHSTYVFPMEVYPTQSYIFDDQDNALAKLEFIEPPPVGKQGEHPVWIGITGDLIEPLWKKILIAVSQIIALRVGITTATLQEMFNPVFEDWELKRFLNWGLTIGIFERLHPDIDGWTVGESWWLVVGEICANLGEEVTDDLYYE